MKKLRIKFGAFLFYKADRCLVAFWGMRNSFKFRKDQTKFM